MHSIMSGLSVHCFLDYQQQWLQPPKRMPMLRLCSNSCTELSRYAPITDEHHFSVRVILCPQVFCEYFKELEEESIRDNFVIIYELLDEVMDFGFPQTTDSKILQEYITQEGHKLEVQPRPPMAVTNAVSWRSEGIKYRKNEVFLDIIESVNLLVRGL